LPLIGNSSVEVTPTTPTGRFCGLRVTVGCLRHFGKSGHCSGHCHEEEHSDAPGSSKGCYWPPEEVRTPNATVLLQPQSRYIISHISHFPANRSSTEQLDKLLVTTSPTQNARDAALDVLAGKHSSAYKAVESGDYDGVHFDNSVRRFIALMREDPEAMKAVHIRKKELALEAREAAKVTAKAKKEVAKQAQKHKQDLYHGVLPRDYDAAFVEGVRMLDNGFSKRHVEAALKEKYIGIEITGEAIRQHRMAGHGQSAPKRPGQEPYLDDEALEGVTGWVKAMRSLELNVFKQQVIAKMQDLIDGTLLQPLFKDGLVRDCHYKRFMDKHAGTFGLKKVKPLEMGRYYWCSSENFKTHYKVVSDMLLEQKLAVVNPDHDDDDPTSCPIFITRPGRVASMGEKHATMDMADSDGRLYTVTVAEDDDTGEFSANKCGGDATLIGGSLANGDSLQVMFIFKSTSFFAGGKDPETGKELPGWTIPAPVSTIIDADTGQPLSACFTCNKQGSYVYKDAASSPHKMHMSMRDT